MILFTKIKNAFIKARILIVSAFYCFLSGFKFDFGMRIYGRPIIKGGGLFNYKIKHKIIIGNSFKCSNSINSNSIGLIQPCVFNVSNPNSKIIIGNNVGISGSTINATILVNIGSNVLIGSGCIISDTDSHPLSYIERRNNDFSNVKSRPINIGDDVFVGARSLILKGVTIGEKSIIGMGSVVTKDIPANCVAAGNPARVIRYLNDEKSK